MSVSVLFSVHYSFLYNPLLRSEGKALDMRVNCIFFWGFWERKFTFQDRIIFLTGIIFCCFMV